jgi:hypothetical protein
MRLRVDEMWAAAARGEKGNSDFTSPLHSAEESSWRTQIERQLSYFRKAIGRSAQSIQIEMMSSFAIQREAVGAMTLQRLVIDAEIR